MVLRVGFVLNPVAGMGGPAGLKGSDEVAVLAAERGYGPLANERGERFLRRLKQRAASGSVRVFTAGGVMGEAATRATSWKTGSLGAESFDEDPFATDKEDTKRAARAAVELGMDLLVFVGGDGTAADVASAVGLDVPVLGVPAGVKMFSECFTDTPEQAAQLVAELAAGFQEGDALEASEADLLDLDEQAYRAGRVQARPTGRLRVPRSPRVLAAKCPAVPGWGTKEAAAGMVEKLHRHGEGAFVLGAGSTLMAVKEALGVRGTLIGIDVVRRDSAGWTLVAADVDAHALEGIVRETGGVTLVLAPLGGQGSLIGRGTGPLTPPVVRAALPDGILVVAAQGKLTSIRDSTLHVDTGDAALDLEFPAYLRVVTAPGREKVVRVAKA